MSANPTYLTNGVLKETMTDAMVNRGYCLDLDNVTQSGFYAVGDDTANRPAAIYGTMECQITPIFRSMVIRTMSGLVYQRVGEASFGVWRVQQTTPVS